MPLPPPPVTPSLTGPPASVHHNETPVPGPPPTANDLTTPLPPPLTAHDLHAPHHAHRQQVAAALDDIQANSTRLRRYRDCAAHHWLMQSTHDPALYRWVRDYCHDRMCPLCSAARSRLIRRNLLPHLDRPGYRFVTLTLRSTDHPLTQQLDYLLASYRRLRRHPSWLAHVRGAAAFVEITRNDDTSRWHPHLHVIVDGTYYPHPDLKTAWYTATKTSTIVHIRYARGVDHVVSYLAGYSTKQAPPNVIANPTALRELILALRSRRLLITTGRWSTYRLLHHDHDPDWICLGHLHDLRGAPAHDPILATLLQQAYDLYLAGHESDRIRIDLGPDDADTPPLPDSADLPPPPVQLPLALHPPPP